MPAIRLKSFSVKGLFGLFDHEIAFKTRDRITILHGPNGVGKTTVLRLIEAVFRPGSSVWREVDFKRIEVKFLPNGTLAITPSMKEERQVGLHYQYRVGDEKKEETVPFRSLAEFPSRVLDDLVPWLERVGPRMWRDRREGDVLTMDEVVERYGEMLPISEGKRARSPEWLTELVKETSVQFIQTQRLRQETRPENRPRAHGREEKEHAVERFAEDLARRIMEKLRESGSLAASLDRTFPKRLLEGTLPREATEENIRKKYQDQQQLRDRLMAVGLLDAGEQVPLRDKELNESERTVLWYYLQDVSEKLKVYMPLLERVELFKSIIDAKKLLYKSMAIDKNKGFQFRSERGTPVPLGSLSSGEQHELVLTYELLFEAQNKSLILIDEPELSLHVLWQQKFLDDMQQIARVADIDFIVATHSPSIVAGQIDLMVELDGRTTRA